MVGNSFLPGRSAAAKRTRWENTAIASLTTWVIREISMYIVQDHKHFSICESVQGHLDGWSPVTLVGAVLCVCVYALHCIHACVHVYFDCMCVYILCVWLCKYILCIHVCCVHMYACVHVCTCILHVCSVVQPVFMYVTWTCHMLHGRIVCCIYELCVHVLCTTCV